MTGPVEPFTTSRIAATIDDLVTLARSTFGDTLDVYDGPTTVKKYAADSISLGIDDPMSADPTASTGAQDWAALGAARREENFTVYGFAVAWTGQSNDGSADQYSLLRRRAFGFIAQLEVALRTDPSVGSLAIGETLRQVGFQVTRVRPLPLNTGSSVHVLFSILCKCRI